VLIPPNAGVGSAIGFLCAPIAFESIRSRFMLLSEFAADALNTVFAELTNEVGEAVRGTNVDMPLHEERHAYMRYRGQGHEISVSLPSRVYASTDREELRQRFNHRYCELFGRNLPGAEVEILTLGVRLSGQALANLDEVRDRRRHDDGAELPVAMVGRRRVFLSGSDGFREIPVLDRAAMQPGEIWPGPCVVTEQTTTTFVPDAFETHVDNHDNLWLHRRART
jgi:N-methylhydantoinase A